MIVKVRFLAHYRDLAGSSEKLLELEDGSTVGTVLKEIGQKSSHFAEILDEAIVSVNKRQVQGRHVLHEGDELVFMPPAVGG